MATSFLLPVVTCGNGTALRLTAAPTGTQQPKAVNSLMIQAHPDNADAVWIGDSTTLASGKIGLKIPAPVAGATLPYITLGGSQGVNPIVLSDLYTDSASAAQKVNVFFLTV